MKAWFLLPLLLVGCASQVRSTVDGYGEGALSRSDPLHFARSELPLAERPIAESCAQAARDLQLPVAGAPCPQCYRVEVRSRMEGVAQATVMGAPAFGSTFGVIGGSPVYGFGVGTAAPVHYREGAMRVIELGFFRGESKDPVRTITVRSIGREHSVSPVAYEMCTAAFEDYPKNVKGEIYQVKESEK